MTTIQIALSQRPMDSTLLKRASKLCYLMNDHESAIEYRLACTETPEDTHESMLQIARMRLGLADGRGAHDALEAAIAAGAPREKHRLTAAYIAYLQRDRAGGFALLDAEQSENGPSQTIKDIRRKLSQLPSVRTERPAIRLQSAATSELRAWAEQKDVPTAELDAPTKRLITEAGDKLIDRAAGSRSLLLAFGGLSTMFGGAAEEMGFLARTMRINTIFVSDPQGLFMLGGFASVGDYWTSVGWIKDLKDAWSLDNV